MTMGMPMGWHCLSEEKVALDIGEHETGESDHREYTQRHCQYQEPSWFSFDRGKIKFTNWTSLKKIIDFASCAISSRSLIHPLEDNHRDTRLFGSSKSPSFLPLPGNPRHSRTTSSPILLPSLILDRFDENRSTLLYTHGFEKGWPGPQTLRSGGKSWRWYSFSCSLLLKLLAP